MEGGHRVGWRELDLRLKALPPWWDRAAKKEIQEAWCRNNASSGTLRTGLHGVGVGVGTEVARALEAEAAQQEERQRQGQAAAAGQCRGPVYVAEVRVAAGHGPGLADAVHV